VIPDFIGKKNIHVSVRIDLFEFTCWCITTSENVWKMLYASNWWHIHKLFGVYFHKLSSLPKEHLWKQFGLIYIFAIELLYTCAYFVK
jgi:hypothetical protein